jgi:hypothetical protein
MVQEIFNTEWKNVILSDMGRWKLHGSEINIKNDMPVLHTNTHSSEMVYSTLQNSVVSKIKFMVFKRQQLLKHVFGLCFVDRAP